MTALSLLIKLLQESEGCRLHAYYDAGGVLTCGWGQCGKDIKKDTVWTQDYANERLFKSANVAINQAIALSPILSRYPNRLASVADFIYNLGAGNYQSSTLKKSVDAGNWTEARRQIMRWDKSRVNGELVALAGLTTRRGKEAALLG